MESTPAVSRWEPLNGGVWAAVSDRHTFGVDALLLAHFASPKTGERVCDLGTGCGILPLLFLREGRLAWVTGVDIQPEAISLAQASLERNGWAHRGEMFAASWLDLAGLLGAGSFDRVTVNPPYFPPGSGPVGQSPATRIARQEREDSLSGLMCSASRLLKNGGRICLCHRPERLPAVFGAMSAAGLEPKRLQPVQNRAGEAPWLVLIEGKKGGHPGLQWKPAWRLDDPAFSRALYRKDWDSPQAQIFAADPSSS